MTPNENENQPTPNEDAGMDERPYECLQGDGTTTCNHDFCRPTPTLEQRVAKCIAQNKELCERCLQPDSDAFNEENQLLTDLLAEVKTLEAMLEKARRIDRRLRDDLADTQAKLAQFEGARIKHQTQPTPTSCVAACVAMVAGIPVEDVLSEFPDPVGGDGLRKMLTHYHVDWSSGPDRHNLEPGKCYLAVVPSLNLKGSNHQIIIDVREDGKVYDPNEGREGKMFYTYPELKDPLAFTLHTWTDLVEVTPRTVIVRAKAQKQEEKP